jgi:predicted deacylase
MPPPFVIGEESIAPGSTVDIALPVTTMATGYNSQLGVRVIHGSREGPTVFVSGAIHGDEIVGTAIIQRLATYLAPEQLAGTLLLVPVANIFGFLGHTRYLPDRRDLNRSFPGTASGSLAGQLAHVFFTEIVARASLGIDIHSAAVHRYNLPQIRIAAGNRRLLDLATAFGAPIIIESPLREGSLRALAQEKGVDMLLMETGEALRFDRLSIQTGMAGVLRVLASLEMVETDPYLHAIAAPARSKKTQWVRSPRGGVTHRVRKSGDAVKEGELLGAVSGLFGEEPAEIVSPITGIIIGHATLPVVHQGDALFHIARVEDAHDIGEKFTNLSDAIYASDPEDFAEVLLDEDEVL